MISVIIPLYNKQDCIKLTIDSCLNQDYDLDYEIVVVDDGSTDNSLSVIESLNSNKVKLFKSRMEDLLLPETMAWKRQMENG